MRVTIAALGWSFDVSLEPTTDASEDQADDGAALNGGTLASTPVGFTPRYDQVEEVPYDQRTPPWDPEDQRR